jgi:hypothetical protein
MRETRQSLTAACYRQRKEWPPRDRSTFQISPQVPHRQ